MGEKYTYDGVDAVVWEPVDPTGLVFIAPGASVEVDDPLILEMQRACIDKGQTVVIADIGRTLIKPEIKFVGGYEDFAGQLQKVVDGYAVDSGFDEFEMVGHSMGAAAAMALSPDYPVSRLILADPVRIANARLEQISCPVHIIASQVRSFRATAANQYDFLAERAGHHTFRELPTSKERMSGHFFRGYEEQIGEIIIDLGLPQPLNSNTLANDADGDTIEPG